MRERDREERERYLSAKNMKKEWKDWRETFFIFGDCFPFSFPDIFVNPPIVVVFEFEVWHPREFLVHDRIFPLFLFWWLSYILVSRGPSPAIYIVERRMKNDSISEAIILPFMRRQRKTFCEPILQNYFGLFFPAFKGNRAAKCKRGHRSVFYDD